MGDFVASKNPIEEDKRRENGAQAMVIGSARKVRKKDGQFVEAKLTPSVESNARGTVYELGTLVVLLVDDRALAVEADAIVTTTVWVTTLGIDNIAAGATDTVGVLKSEEICRRASESSSS